LGLGFAQRGELLLLPRLARGALDGREGLLVLEDVRDRGLEQVPDVDGEHAVLGVGLAHPDESELVAERSHAPVGLGGWCCLDEQGHTSISHGGHRYFAPSVMVLPKLARILRTVSTVVEVRTAASPSAPS